ncbi:MAG: protein translocase subunit SecF [Ancalomicrobiaceae bacterium]|nr:protein translocase subunit SecF [Ancalomicrobiaceae bacterium]
MKLLRLVPDNTRFRFMHWGRITIPLALGLVFVSILGWAILGFNFGIDFTGGLLIEVRQTQGLADLAKIRSDVESLKLGDAQVQGFGQQSDALIRLGEQPGGEKAQQAAVEKVRAKLGSTYEFRRVEVVGPAVSKDLQFNAVMAVVTSLVLILAYLWFRFEWQFAVGAIMTTIHDVLLTLGFMAYLRISFDLPILAAILTIVGYSLNDTVVIYDRIREMMRKYKKMPIADLIELSINETLSRTVVTAVTVFIASLSLLLFGGDALHGFSFILVFGVIVGTYSSIVVSAPLLIFLHLRTDKEEKPGKGGKAKTSDATAALAKP